jgi:hypothetical protein
MAGGLQKKVIVVGLARLAVSAAAIAVNVVLARGLARELNGLVQQALIIAGVAVLLGQSGIQTSAYTFLPRLRPGQRRAFFAQSTVLLLVLGGLAAAGALLAAPWLAAEWGSPRLVGLVVALAGYIFFSVAASAAEAALLTQERQFFFLGATVLWAALHAGGVVAFLLLGRPLEWVLGALSFAAAARFAGFTLLAWNALPPGESKTAGGAGAGAGGIDAKDVASGLALEHGLLFQQLAFIAPLAVHGGIDVFSRWLDRSLVSTLFRPNNSPSIPTARLRFLLSGFSSAPSRPFCCPNSPPHGPQAIARASSICGAAPRSGPRRFCSDDVFPSAARAPVSRCVLCEILRQHTVFPHVSAVAAHPHDRLHADAFCARAFGMGAGRGGDRPHDESGDQPVADSAARDARAGHGNGSGHMDSGQHVFVVIGNSLGAPVRTLLPWRRLARLAVEVAAVSIPLWGLAFLKAPSWVIFGAGGAYCAAWAALRLRRLW